MKSLTRSAPSRAPRTESANRFYTFVLSCVALSALLLSSNGASAACNFLLKWGTPGSDPGQFLSNRGIALDSAGNVYVSDSNTRIQKFSSAGVFISQFATGGSSSGSVVSAAGVTVDSAGNIYITDAFTERTSGVVQKFNSAGTFVDDWGTLGTGNGQFFGAFGIAADSAGFIYVMDPGNHRVQKFTNTGTFVTSWGGVGSGDGQFSAALGVAVDALNNVYVADTSNHRIQKFTSTGTFITKWGTSGTANGQFNGPSGLAVDGLGNVHVADTGNNRIQSFSNTGTFISSCGTVAGGSGDGEFLTPQGIAAHPDGTTYVADTGNERVQKFGVASLAPIANAGPDQTVECTGATTSVTLDGSASTAGSGTISSYTWTEGATTLGTGATLLVSLPLGSHTITLTVEDTGGGSDTDNVVINIVDTVAPSITCPSDIVVSLPMNSSATSMVVNYPAVTATDGCSSSVTVNSTPASGSVFTVGTTTVEATANDGNGNEASCSFTVTVNYNFAGFFQPVDNLPAFNSVQAGRAIPIKFSLSGNKGLDIFAPGSPSSGPIVCGSGDAPIALEETVTAGNSSLSYDPSSDQYIYVWKTEASWAGTCRQLVVQLNDGSIHRANFKFK